MGNRIGPNPSKVVGQREKIPVKGSARATTSKAPFTGEYCNLLSLNQPPKTDDPTVLSVYYLSLREMEIYDKIVLEGNPNLCMH